MKIEHSQPLSPFQEIIGQLFIPSSSHTVSMVIFMLISIDGYLTDKRKSFVINYRYIDVSVREEISRKVFEEPFVLVNVLGRGPPHRVRLEHVTKQAHDALVQVFGNGEDAG